MPLRATATAVEPDLLFLPWNVALADWPEDITVALPRGISRHIVRFVRVNGRIYAVKEIEESFAKREYELLTELVRLKAPSVIPVGVIAGRVDEAGEPLPGALITEHLAYSLPYRALIRQTLSPQTAVRLLDALALLIVKLHLLGFAWNDCSLSNTLFRRDAEEFAAYLVDAETGELRPGLSRGQRRYDIETAAINVTGELMDLQAGGFLPESMDPIDMGEDLQMRYEHLWGLLTDPIAVDLGDRQRLHTMLRTLNGLGFDVAELTASTTASGQRIEVLPKVVDAGHHRRRMLRLTGLEMDENLARRLLNDIDTMRVAMGAPPEDEPLIAHRWLTEVYEPVLAAIPEEMRGRLADPQVMHEVLEHRWYLSERAHESVDTLDAAADYVRTVLAVHPHEAAVLPDPAESGEAEDIDSEYEV